MIVYVAAEIDFDRACAAVHLGVLFFEDEKELTCVHDWVQLSQSLSLSIRPKDVEEAPNNATKRWKDIFTFDISWWSESLKKFW